MKRHRIQQNLMSNNFQVLCNKLLLEKDLVLILMDFTYIRNNSHLIIVYTFQNQQIYAIIPVTNAQGRQPLIVIVVLRIEKFI